MLAGTLPKLPRVSWLLPLVWFALSFQSIRHGPLFCAVGLVALADLLPHTVWFRLLQRYGDTFVRTPEPPGHARWLAGVIPAVVVGICALIPGKVKLDPRHVPVDLLGPVQQYADLRPDGTPVFNDANLGGFVIYYAPHLQVFMDDRCELYGEEFMGEYV